MQILFQVGQATHESAFHAVRGGSYQRVGLHDLDGPGHTAVRIEQSFELLSPWRPRLGEKSPQLQLPEARARDACALIQADVETELVSPDPAGPQRLTDGVAEGINVERVE